MHTILIDDDGDDYVDYHDAESCQSRAMMMLSLDVFKHRDKWWSVGVMIQQWAHNCNSAICYVDNEQSKEVTE